MKTAVIYARYSCDAQTEQSIEGQLRVCKQYAEKNDLLIVDQYIERATTGTNDNRAAFQQMLRDSKKAQWSVVIVLSKVFEDSDDVKARKLLMNTFVREVIWYGDRLVITYNFQEDIVPEKLTKSHVEQVEKEIEEVENASSSFALGSYKFSFGAPNAFPSGKALLLQKTNNPYHSQADSGGGVAQPPSTAQRAQALPFPAPNAFPSGKALLLQKTNNPYHSQADSGGGVAQPPSTAQRAQALPFPAPRKEAF